MVNLPAPALVAEQVRGSRGDTTAERRTISISNTYPSSARSTRTPAVGSTPTSGTRPTSGGSVRSRGGERAPAAARRAFRERSRSRSPARDLRQAFSPPGFPSVLIDLRPERPCPTFFEPEPEPEVREDLDARRSFNEKLQAVITLAPQVGQCFLEIGYLYGRQELRRREIQLLGAEGRPLGELPVELDPPSTWAGSRPR